MLRSWQDLYLCSRVGVRYPLRQYSWIDGEVVLTTENVEWSRKAPRFVRVDELVFARDWLHSRHSEPEELHHRSFRALGEYGIENSEEEPILPGDTKENHPEEEVPDHCPGTQQNESGRDHEEGSIDPVRSEGDETIGNETAV